MLNNNQLTKSNLEKLIQSDTIDNLTLEEIKALFIKEYTRLDSKPSPLYQIDPRNHNPVIFNPSRSSRPHTYSQNGISVNLKACPICNGQTTGVLDVAPLSEGFTFINKNLFPALFPYSRSDIKKIGRNHTGISTKAPCHFAHGLHFLQWTSSLHNNKWSNMPEEDCYIVMKRLASLEKKLLGKDTAEPNYVSIYKNVGRLVGSSIAHDHQQILMSNIMPRRVADHLAFKRENGINFSDYIINRSPQELILSDYGEAVILVPYFMKRPYNMMLFVKNTTRSYYHDLNKSELTAIVKGWKDAISAIEQIFLRIGKELAFNVVTHNGPGCGLYIEFLPYIQEYGGLEHSGLFLCQNEPYKAASELQEISFGK